MNAPSPVPGNLPSQPLQAIAPVDQVQVAHVQERSLVTRLSSPPTTSHADQPVIEPFDLLENAMGQAEERPKTWLHGRPVGEVSA